MLAALFFTVYSAALSCVASIPLAAHPISYHIECVEPFDMSVAQNRFKTYCSLHKNLLSRLLISKNDITGSAMLSLSEKKTINVGIDLFYSKEHCSVNLVNHEKFFLTI